MYKFFSIFAGLAIAFYFLSDPLLSLLGTKCVEDVFWYCKLPTYFSYAFSILSGITLLIGVFQSVKNR